MRRLRPVLGSFAFLLVAPGVIAVVLPWAISDWRSDAPLWLQVAGATLALGAAIVLLVAFGRFAIQGLGTPAPIAPTARLVVWGSYRYVRNPMYLAVVAIILGQAAIFGSAELVLYAAAVLATVALFVRGYEEPALVRQFGRDYEDYREAVPGWLPRARPWTEAASSRRRK